MTIFISWGLSRRNFSAIHPIWKSTQREQWPSRREMSQNVKKKMNLDFTKEFFSTPSDIAIERVVKEYVYF